MVATLAQRVFFLNQGLSPLPSSSSAVKPGMPRSGRVEERRRWSGSRSRSRSRCLPRSLERTRICLLLLEVSFKSSVISDPEGRLRRRCRLL